MINNKSSSALSITYLHNLGLVFGGHFSFSEPQSFLCFLTDMFGERLLSDQELQASIVTRMLRMKNVTNKFATEVEKGSWNRKKLPFKPLSSNDLLDFPAVSLNNLKILFTGIY